MSGNRARQNIGPKLKGRVGGALILFSRKIKMKQNTKNEQNPREGYPQPNRAKNVLGDNSTLGT